MTHVDAPGDGLRLHCVLVGQDRGLEPPLVLLHGFPDHWACWRDVARRMGDQRLLIIPDGRGVNLSDQADGAYQLERLVEDVAALAGRFSPGRRIDLAGHDWGGVTAWAVATLRPELLRQVTIFNAPHPAVLARAIAEDPAQRAASAYVGLLRAPGAEARLKADGYAALLGAFAELDLGRADQHELRGAWDRAGLAGALGWYRAADFAMPGGRSSVPATRIETPVRLVWGVRDQALLPSLAEAHRPFCPRLEIEWIPDGGHWLPRSHPDLAVRMLQRPPGAAGDLT